jgi:hypothetical protein
MDAKTITRAQSKKFLVELWPAVCRAKSLDRNDRPARLEFIGEAIGRPVESLLEVGYLKEFDALIGACRAVSEPDNLDAQLRQLRMPRTRLIQKITEEQAACLTLYMPGTIQIIREAQAQKYIVSVIKDKFATESILSLKDDQLDHLRSTLARAIDRKRQFAGHTVSEMHRLASVADTAGVTHEGRADVPVRPENSPVPS